MKTSKIKTLIFIVTTVIVISVSTTAQNFSGQIFDAKTKEPISYVNIGIMNQGVGTVSDEYGNFSLNLSDKYNKDTLKIFVIGYRAIFLNVQDAKTKDAKLYLEQSSYELGEVVVRPVHYKTKVVGNTDLGEPSIAFIGDSTKPNVGYEVGTLIHIKKRTTYIDNISFGVCKNEYDSITIRLNIYDEKTNENVLKHPVYVTVKKGDKIVTVDTKKYNIMVYDDFIIAFEALEILQIKSRKEKNIGNKFMFSGGFFGSDMLMRENIYDTWQKVPVIVIGFNATITYEDSGNWFTNLFK